MCFPRKELETFYSDEQGRLSAEVVAHLVTCARCLDEVNRILGLPMLADRYASDLTGKDTRRKGGPGGGSSGAGGGGLRASLGRYVRRAQQVYRHEPQELCVAVNGYLQSTQKISSEQSELTLVVDTAEQIGFVEVFSEQGIRLLLLNVEPLPTGAVRQDARVDLSEGRTLDASLSFSGAWPTVHVAYHDPHAQDLTELTSEDLIVGPSMPRKELDTGATVDSSIQETNLPITHSSEGNLSRLREWSKRVFQTGFWLRPGTVTALFALVLIAGLLLVWRSKTPAALTAGDLLQRATQAEEISLTRPDTVVHRTLQIEARRGSLEGEVLSSQRVEVWQSAARGVTARRLYDADGRLVAGEWTNKDNVATFYHHGARPELRLANPTESQLDSDHIWQLSPSAKEFTALVGGPQGLRLEERANHYALNFDSVSPSPKQKLVRATLVMGRDDLHAVEQTLVVQQGAELRAYRISETSFERRSVNAVAPAVFEPEPELLETDSGIRGHGDTETLAASPRLAVPVSVLATPELEVEVLRLLNSAGGDLSDQVSVSRTTDGRLRVEGTVETARRKADILHALSPVNDHPAIAIHIDTVAEAEQKEAKTKKAPTTIELQQVEIARTALPIEPELRGYLASRGVSASQYDQEIARFASRVMRRSLQARLYARTLKQTMNRFSPDDLRALTPEARQKLMSLIREQATSLSRELAALSNELQLVVPGVGSSSGSEQLDAQSDADLLRAVNRLGELVAHADEAVRASFSISSEGGGAAPVKEAAFWRSLESAEGLAQKLSRP